MTINSIFGVALAPLFAAIAEVESNNGLTSDNVYQLTNIFVDDVNRISKTESFTYNDVFDREKSERMMEIYWGHYVKEYYNALKAPPTWEALARIHNGGPNGATKYATKKYWRRVKAFLPDDRIR